MKCCEMCEKVYETFEECEKCEDKHVKNIDKYYGEWLHEQEMRKLMQAARSPSQQRLL